MVYWSVYATCFSSFIAEFQYDPALNPIWPRRSSVSRLHIDESMWIKVSHWFRDWWKRCVWDGSSPASGDTDNTDAVEYGRGLDPHVGKIWYIESLLHFQHENSCFVGRQFFSQKPTKKNPARAVSSALFVSETNFTRNDALIGGVWSRPPGATHRTANRFYTSIPFS